MIVDLLRRSALGATRLDRGSLSLGVNRWRTTWKIAVRTARPAIVAGTVLATARAIGEAVMLGMVSGSVGFAPNPRRRLRLPLRALPLAGPDDHQEHRFPRLGAGQGDAVRDRLGAAVLGRVLLARRLGRAPLDAEIRDSALMSGNVAAPAPPTPEAPPPAHDKGPRTPAPPGSCPIGSGSRSAGRSGFSFARSRSRSSSTCSSRASSTCGPRCSGLRQAGVQRGGIGRLLGRRCSGP